MMLTPYYPGGVLGPNPKFIVPTGKRLQIRKVRRSVSLYFGHGGYLGRMIGFGVVKSRSKTAEARPFQLFRMDYHPPNRLAHQNEHPLQYWEVGGGDYHFHLVDDRR